MVRMGTTIDIVRAKWLSMTSPETKTEVGVLLIGHGTREPAGLEEFRDLARRLSQQLGSLPMESCFLELAEPDINAGFARLLSQSVSTVVAAPALLFAAGHAHEDIPRALSLAAAKHPGLSIRQAPVLGGSQSILELSARRYREAMSVVGQDEPGETFLLLVGRGSRDEAATAEMFRFTELRRTLTPVALAQPAFVAMAQPGLIEGLSQAVVSGKKRIVVQPHLLFDGLVRAEIEETVRDFERRWPDRQWLVSRHLGPDDLVIEALREAIEQVV